MSVTFQRLVSVRRSGNESPPLNSRPPLRTTVPHEVLLGELGIAAGLPGVRTPNETQTIGGLSEFERALQRLVKCPYHAASQRRAVPHVPFMGSDFAPS